jgi:phenylpyruvate tautomerase PptA (4-oxalocrotonate tautomerase family)
MQDPLDPTPSETGGDEPNHRTRRTVISQIGFLSLVGLASANSIALLAQSAIASKAEASVPLSVNDSTQDTPLMPLVKIDAYEGRSESEVKTLLDSAHRAVVKAFHINEHDRYQIYDARPKSHFVMQDTGLGIPRTDKALIITVFCKDRPEILKRRLYKEMTAELQRSASIPPSDVMMAIFENGAADWTFGNGEPQFLTGDLG